MARRAAVLLASIPAAVCGLAPVAYGQTQFFYSGGTTATDVAGSTDRFMQFLASGTVSSTTSFNVTSTGTITQLLIVGGGGGGGVGGNGVGAAGGGGAGEYYYSASPVTLTSGTTLSVIVGGGGSGGVTGANATARGQFGGNSVFNGVTARGGGGGGESDNQSGNNPLSVTGGSGGGGPGRNSAAGATRTAASGSGNNGGNGLSPYAGGGGGASTSGSNATSSKAGDGGNGIANSITGASVTYAGGGGGGSGTTTAISRGVGGAGGGGSGGYTSAGPATSGSANTGGGGGGGGNTSGNDRPGAAGGSGIVVVRYAAPYQYWDTGTTAGLGGSGTWGGSNWTFDPTGGAGITPGSFTNTARAAVFNSSVSSTVTVAGSQSAGGLFVSQGYVKFDDGGSGAINLGSGTASISGGQANINVGLTANGGINIGNAATLGGVGTITGLTTFNGGTHSPGNSPGVQTFASGITYAAPTTVKWELWGNTTSNSGTAFDQIIVSGGTLAFSATTTLALDFGAVGSSVNWTDSFWNTSRTGTDGWLLYDVTGPSAVTGLGGSGTLNPLTSNLQIQTSSWLDASGTAFSTARPNASFSLFQDPTSGDVYVAYAIPEPASLGMFAVGGAAAILAYRRLHRRRRGAA